jgi:surface antigen
LTLKIHAAHAAAVVMAARYQRALHAVRDYAKAELVSSARSAASCAACSSRAQPRRG